VKTVSQLLQDKGREVWSVSPDASVYEAIALMSEKGVGALVVMQGGAIAGMISERDYARKVILEERSSKETRVGEIMTSRVVCAQPDQSVEQCMALMTEKRIRHLPVVDGTQLLGMVSIGDLVKAIIADQQFVISQLEHYING
jgi:CBS domain-containing protein